MKIGDRVKVKQGVGRDGQLSGLTGLIITPLNGMDAAGGWDHTVRLSNGGTLFFLESELDLLNKVHACPTCLCKEKE